MGNISLGVAAFWLALAAVIIAIGWFRSRSEALKHETLRAIVEKTGQLDESKLNPLFNPPFDHAKWKTMMGTPDGKAGDAYRFLCIVGTLALFAAAGLLAFFVFMLGTGFGDRDNALAGIGACFIVAIGGIGFFVASRFAEPPPRLRKGDLDRS